MGQDREALRRLCHRGDLDLLVDRRRRMDGIDQLLLAQANRLKAFWRNLECVKQHFADRVGSPLTQRQIIFASARRHGMADDQEFVSQQRRMIKRICDAPERSIGIGPNDRSVSIKLNFGKKLRQLEQLRGDGRSFYRRGIGFRLGSLQSLLPQGSDIQIRRGFKASELTDPVFRRAARLALRQGRQRREADQPDDEQANATSNDPLRNHQRYPASLMALLQLMLTPRGPANKQSTAWPLPFWMPAQNLATSRWHNLATAERAATRFWIASKARTKSFLH